TEHAEVPRIVLRDRPAKSLGNAVQRFIPGGDAMPAIFAHERLSQAALDWSWHRFTAPVSPGWERGSSCLAPAVHLPDSVKKGKSPSQEGLTCIYFGPPKKQAFLPRAVFIAFVAKAIFQISPLEEAPHEEVRFLPLVALDHLGCG